MARMYGFTGKVSGKMGSAVFRVRGGTQVVTQYNPIVANPNTAGQQNGRARFKLVSQLAAIFAPTIKSFGANIIKEGNEGVNAAFVRLNYPLTSIDPDPAAAEKATIPLDTVQLTNSNRPFGTMSSRVAAGVGSISITSPGAAAARRKGKVALVGYGTMGVTKRPYVMSTQDIEFDDDDTIQVDFEDLAAGDYVVLAFGIDVTNVNSRLELGNMQQDEDSDNLVSVDINSMLRDGTAAVTSTIGATFTIPA